MNRITLRLIAILGAFSIIGIILTQIHWVKQAYDLQERQLNKEIHFGLKSVAYHIYKYHNSSAPEHKIVNQVDKDYFVVRLNNSVEHEVLEHLIKREFQRRNLTIDFEFGTYDCHSEEMSYGNYVRFSDRSKHKELDVKKAELPVWAKDSYYFGVMFPNKDAELFKRIELWSVSSVVVLIVIIFFTYTLFIVFKQKRLSEIQKDFINNMTHEFKTPISTIAISSNVIKNSDLSANPERLKNYAGIISDEVARLKNQVERILQMATIDKEKIRLKLEEINLHKVIQETIQIIQATLESKNGKINLDLQASGSYVYADKLHITNVLYNLLDNAIKYNENEPQITISTESDQKSVYVRIKDNGIGISPDMQKKIFEKFYRIPTGNIHNVKGFGLGLNYVKEILKSHKGKIVVDSELNKGSVFSLCLPLLKKAQTPAPAEKEKAKEKAPQV